MFQEIIDDYYKCHQQNLNDELEDFSSLTDIKTVLERVAHCKKKNGKRFSHQCRIMGSACQQSQDKLFQLSFDHINDFQSLYDLLTEHLLPIYGIGRLYVYDATLRLGSYLNLMPEKIYLHAGTLIGARNLNLDISKGYLESHELPQPLQHINPIFVEAILCIYKDGFMNGQVDISKLKGKMGCDKKSNGGC